MRWIELTENLDEEVRLPLRRGEIPKARGSYGAFIITMHPLDFLKLTTTNDEGIAQIQDRKFPATEEEYYDPTLRDFGKFEMPFLTVAFPSGKILGHEGRHRSAMILKQGGTKVPVIIYPKSEGKWIGVATYYNSDGYRETNSTTQEYTSKSLALDAAMADIHRLNIPEEDIIKLDYKFVGNSTLKGEPNRSEGWDHAAWKKEDFPEQLVGQYSSYRATNFQIGLVKGYRHFKR